MLIDHVGLKFFPTEDIFRIIGRLSFPIFAYFIAEGCRHTRNRAKRFFLIFFLGVLCETAYILYTHRLQGNILLTFSVSILLIYCLQLLKRCIASKRPVKIIFSSLLFVLATAAAYPLSRLLDLDYGFAGIILPLFVTLLDYKVGEAPACLMTLDRLPYRLFAFFIGLLLLVYTKGFSSLQAWSLLSILPISLYNGRLGSRRMKYGFYLFYPTHLLLLKLVAILIGR